MNLMQLRAQFPALMQTVDGKSPVFLDGPGGSQVGTQCHDRLFRALQFKLGRCVFLK